eukprot:TRINITY_DN6068_c0_g1_i1.p1 TRINITY_DN6068_c0_g1~~TRINITY_DN6068_c0_g1_i1.p1  ORF type:complete len:223 (-),score=65.57 TRINITY_DN6068_c0_g1_i1:33-680(-)
MTEPPLKKHEAVQPTCWREVTFVTGNANKLREVRQILARAGVAVKNLELDLTELQGDSDEIALAKCEEAMSKVKGLVLVEDVSLCFNALGGMPGPYIKWFLGKLGPEGLYKMLSGFEDKKASAVCTFALGEAGCGKPQLFVGTTPGTVVKPRGKTGFGWDPIFLPDGQDSTYAELSAEVKNTISHRARALEKVFEHFNELQAKEKDGSKAHSPAK